MKNWMKAACALILTGMMALSASAAYIPKKYTPAAREVAAAAEKTETFALPKVTGAKQIEITSSLTADSIDLTPLYDASAETTVAFTGDVSISMTSKEAFCLAALVTDDAADSVKIFASDNGTDWVELQVKTTTKDGFAVHRIKKLYVDYKFYRLDVAAGEEGLSLETLAMYEAEENVWPLSLYVKRMIGGAKR